MRAFALSVALSLALAAPGPARAAAAPPGPAIAERVEAGGVTILLANGTPREDRTRTQLASLLERHDLKRWRFTDTVVIESRVQPHSHPVLTLNTRYEGRDDLLLSVYLHEQIHWHLSDNLEQMRAARAALRSRYPEVPVGGAEGARDEDSTYLHLLVNLLEYRAMQALVGAARADAAFEFWSGDHYTWIYRTVLEDEAEIAAIAAQHRLTILPASG